jgi:DNA-binding MarR family transcriptional regulator
VRCVDDDSNCVDIDRQGLASACAENARWRPCRYRLTSSTMSDHLDAIVDQWHQRRPELDLTGMAVFGRIYRLARLADLQRNAALEPHGLQVGDVDVLAALWRSDGGLRPLDLRRTMMVGSGTLTARLDRMEAAGLLERRPDPHDRRGRVLYLTAAGERLVPDLVVGLLEIENRFLAELPARTRDRLATDLGRLLASAEAQVEDD